MKENTYNCDIIIPVFNGLAYVKECVNSIIKYTEDCSYKLYVIDDNSDKFTHSFLANIAMNHHRIYLHQNNENIGYLKSCNIGIQLSQSRYIVLMNSDIIVTPRWLSRMLKCLESDPRIAAVNPFTNHASNINIPMAPGANFLGMNDALESISSEKYPDVVTCVGFCLLLRRSALDKVGLYDEVFGRGYCEESDLCMRLTTNGYRTVIADNTYVYHKGQATFSDRGERYKKNRKIFDARWKNEYQRQFRSFLSENPLKQVRDQFVLRQQWSPELSMRETYRRMRYFIRHRDYAKAIHEVVRGVRRLPKSKRDIVTPGSVAKVTRPNRLKVSYVLHHLTIAGGVLSVVQLVNELILLGVEARIIALRDYPEIYNWNFYTKPIIFKNVSELIENFPDSDIAVATHWTTAPWVYRLIKRKRVRKSVYFLQDYESWFFSESDESSQAKVKNTYRLIPNKIVKSTWLKTLMANDGYSTKKIHLGMDLSLFYPRGHAQKSHPVVLAMARPGTPRRGFPYIIRALSLIKQAMDKVEIVLFGDDLSIVRIPFHFRDEGIITKQEKLARLYSEADVFLDGSDFQGFGRTALEAMACGTACVLTNAGGVTEYARNEENCLLVPPQKPDLFAQAVMRILNNTELKNRLVQKGLETVKEYSHKREAQETLTYFYEIFDPK